MRRDGYKEAYRMAGIELEVDTVDTVDAVSKELPAPEIFPVGAMPQGCRRLVREAAAAIGCPPEMVAVPMLVTLGTAVGNSRVIRLKQGWDEGATLYAAVVADPGEKKTPAYKVAIEPAINVQAHLREIYRNAEDEYKRELREYEADKRNATKAGEPAPPPPQPPVMERTVVEDTTVEALAVVMEGTPRGVAAVRDELAGWVRAMDQYRSAGRGADRQFWLSAWSNSYSSVDRKGRCEPLIISRPFVGVFGSIQPGVMPELGGGREDGLLDRFVFAYPEPVPSRWTDDEISIGARDEYRKLYDGLRERHMPEDEHGDPEPVRLHFSPDAKAVFKDAVNAVREEMEQPGFPARLKGPWSKLEAYTARFALILAMCRAVDAGDPERVEDCDVLSAVALVGYFKAMVRRVYLRLHGEDPLEVLAADVAALLEGWGGSFRDEPSVLHERLNSRCKPDRPDELTKNLKAMAARVPGIAFESGNFKKDGESRRFVALALRHGVNGVNRGKGSNGG